MYRKVLLYQIGLIQFYSPFTFDLSLLTFCLYVESKVHDIAILH